MATTAAIAVFPKMLKILRENSSVNEKREALIYISSQAKKLEPSGVVKDDQYRELCKLVVEAFTKEGGRMQYEALEALNSIVCEFHTHSLHLFEALLQTDKRTRLKILKLLEIVGDNAIIAVVNDGQTLNFFKTCMDGVQPNLMEWMTPTGCTDNLQMLTKIEQQVLSDEQKLEEDIIAYSFALLKRLYKLPAMTLNQNIEKFDTLLMDKVVTLAYMGHKRQRNSALKVLQQAVTNNSSLRIRKNYPDLWTQYKTNLQSMYCKRMSLLVAAYEPDWTIQWNITIQFLGTDLHRGASLINNLLSVEEKAFKSTDSIIRRQAFLSWKLLIDNFALNHQELATARRIKLLCIPLNAKNSKTELIALTKLEVWWHLIIKLYKDIVKFTSVIAQFLNFCFGPLGDTPLLSTKFNVVASPGKRFFKTKVVAMNALYQLIVPKQDGFSSFCAPMLEERLPNTMTSTVFQECSKSIIHSTGEALLILCELTDEEMKNRFHFGKILWASLLTYIKDVKLENKDYLYRDVILVVTELLNHIDKHIVKDMILNVILLDLNQIFKHINFVDHSLPELVLKFLSLPVLGKVPRYFNYHKIMCLLQQCVNPEITYSTGVLGFLEAIMENLRLVCDRHKNMTVYADLWSLMAEILTDYIENYKNIDEGNVHNFKVVKSVLSFPLEYICLENFQQMQDQAIVWKALYRQFELQSESISTVKPNEILLETASMMRTYLNANKNCSSLIINCLDALLNTINYEHLLAQNEIPSIVELIIDVTTTSFNNLQNFNCEIALKALSSVLITIYGHDSQKVKLYLHNCKTVIQLTLKSQLEALFKEVINIWETVISIFKGLKKHLNHELLSSYKEVIVTAINHPNQDLRSLTQSIFEIRDDLDNTAKCILDELEKTLEESHSKSDSVIKKKGEAGKPKEMHVIGSFLNRKSTDTKSVSKPLEKDNKKAVILSEPDSQDYVYIKTDLKFDVNRLTEHQKETLKKKREDIPALYNDLSQSSSQNSQNLQEWFDIKAKHINESDKANNKKSECTVQININNDANKENKIIVSAQTELNVIDKIVDNNNSSRLGENIAESIDIEQKKDSEKERKDSGSHNENVDTSRQTGKSISHTKSLTEQDATLQSDEEKAFVRIGSVAKRLDFESREEFPEDKTYERQSSPSMLDSTKRRHSNRNSITKSNSSVKSDEVVENQRDSSTPSAVQKTTRTKTNQGKHNASDNKQKPHSDTEVKDNSNENKRGVKRKYASDVESDGIIQQRRKRKLTSKDSNDSHKGPNDDNSGAVSSLDVADLNSIKVQRMRNEISRLRIDMVFDCPAVNRRRVKHSDEGDKETPKKTWTFDSKSLRMKSVETTTSLSKRSPKAESAKDANDTNQAIFKRRSRRSAKQEAEKSDSADVAREAAKSNNTTDKVSQLKSSTDADAKCAAPTSSQAVQDTTIGSENENKNEKLDKDHSKLNKNIESSEIEPNESRETEPSGSSQDDEIEDVVESSQTPSASLKLDKKCGEKQCFIKINKMTNVQAVKISDVIVEKDYVPESVPMDSTENVPDTCEQTDEANLSNNTETNSEASKNSINKDTTQATDNSNTKAAVLENQKIVDGLPLIKFTSVANFPSPKTSIKVFSKLKPFTIHGRAAHMLGLVTKQSRSEGDGVALDDSPIKKLRNKDAESEASTCKKTAAIREMDKIGGSSGSRQEKIFSNMRSADYCTSLPTNVFIALKSSDGEKPPSKSDKSDSLSTESSIDKENEGNASPPRDKDNLPMLEWSSANPPSLTASPSASILKRNRSAVSELDDSTPKRKRVSFADPPVSKEMGYEVSVTESPHKANKSAARSLTPRKDSPLRFKQTKLRFIPIDVERSIIVSDAAIEGGAVIASRTERTNNDSLTQICEAYADVANAKQALSDPPGNDNVAEINTHVRIDIDDVAQEIEMTADAPIPCVPQDEQLLPFETLQNSAPTDCAGVEESETQRDIFDGTIAKNSSPSFRASNDEIEMFVHDNTADSIKLDVPDDSVMQALPAEEDTLEDTVDIQNVTELSSAINSDEVFCGKLMRTSTRTADTMMEQDTLPVTDSAFTSLPSIQDSRIGDNQDDVELEPAFLDSTVPICPTLSSCLEPIDTIVERLTNPLWKQNLSAYFANRNLRTIGDLAQLSEREVYRMPVKGKSKTEFVKRVLQRFESTSFTVCCKRSLTSCACIPRAKALDKTERSPAAATERAASVSAAPSAFDPVEASSAAIYNESLSCSTISPLARSAEGEPDDPPTVESPTEQLDETKSASDTCSTDVSSKSDTSAINVRMDAAEVLVAADSLPRTSTDRIVPVATSSVCTSTETRNEIIPSSNDSLNLSEISSLSSNMCGDSLVTFSSTGTSTDEPYSSMQPSVGKATRSVESQMALEDLLDEIDVNLVLENAVKRCTPEAILSQYKMKMGHLSEVELTKETVRMLGLQNKSHFNDALLKTACRAYTTRKVLLKLPDIFNSDKEFFDKVFQVYSDKLKMRDCLSCFDFAQLRNAFHQRCTSSEFVEMLSDKLKQEDQEGIKRPALELSSLNALLQTLPMDAIVSGIVANEEIVPAPTVLDVALRNNSSEVIARALKLQSPAVVARVLDELWTSQFTAIANIKSEEVAKESLLDAFKSVCSKLTAQELLDAYREAMTSKLAASENQK